MLLPSPVSLLLPSQPQLVGSSTPPRISLSPRFAHSSRRGVKPARASTVAKLGRTHRLSPGTALGSAPTHAATISRGLLTTNLCSPRLSWPPWWLRLPQPQPQRHRHLRLQPQLHL